jgi:hypothetical protein
MTIQPDAMRWMPFMGVVSGCHEVPDACLAEASWRTVGGDVE